MFKKLFGFLGQVRAVKNTISKLLEIVDRADDDLDDNGKSELADILDDADALKDGFVISCKAHFAEAQKIYARAQKLVRYVATGEK